MLCLLLKSHSCLTFHQPWNLGTLQSHGSAWMFRLFERLFLSFSVHIININFFCLPFYIRSAKLTFQTNKKNAMGLDDRNTFVFHPFESISCSAMLICSRSLWLCQSNRWIWINHSLAALAACLAVCFFLLFVCFPCWKGNRHYGFKPLVFFNSINWGFEHREMLCSKSYAILVLHQKLCFAWTWKWNSLYQV